MVIGDTTFGKGSVQSILPLDKTYHIKLTTAFYYTPSGRCINRPENAIRGSTLDEELVSEEGETEKTEKADSVSSSKIDTTQYKTKNGRIVYGSGGIIPDTVITPALPSLPVRALFVKDAFFQFANYEYPRLKKRKIKVDSSFVVDDVIMKDFQNYLDSIKFSFQTVPQLRFNEFKMGTGIKDTVDSAGKKVEIYPEQPKWNDKELQVLKSCAAKIDSLLNEESRRTFSSNNTEIRKHLKEAFLVREFGQDHEIYYRTKLADDVQMKAALALLSDSVRYNSFLKGKPAVQVESKK